MKIFTVGIQLYSIRDEMEKDMDAAFGALKALGYDYVEFAGYFGKSAEELSGLLDKHHLACVSAIQPGASLVKDWQQAADYAKAVGVKYLAMGYGRGVLRDKFAENVKSLINIGKLLKDNGIGLLYHNHDSEFEKVNGEYILDRLFAAVPADLLNPLIDTGWARYAGVNPSEYLGKYAGRMPAIHLKDFARKDDGDELAGCPVGKGIQDIPAVLAAAENAGVGLITVEDECKDIPQLEAAKISREYLRTLGL